MPSTSITLQVNQSISLTSNIIDAYGALATASTINYVVSDPTIVRLANNGTFVVGAIPQNSISTNTIYALTNGTATVTVSVDGTQVVDIITITVNSPPPADLNFVFGTPISS